MIFFSPSQISIELPEVKVKPLTVAVSLSMFGNVPSDQIPDLLTRHRKFRGSVTAEPKSSGLKNLRPALKLVKVKPEFAIVQ